MIPDHFQVQCCRCFKKDLENKTGVMEAAVVYIFSQFSNAVFSLSLFPQAPVTKPPSAHCHGQQQHVHISISIHISTAVHVRIRRRFHLRGAHGPRREGCRQIGEHLTLPAHMLANVRARHARRHVSCVTVHYGFACSRRNIYRPFVKPLQNHLCLRPSTSASATSDSASTA